MAEPEFDLASHELSHTERKEAWTKAEELANTLASEIDPSGPKDITRILKIFRELEYEINRINLDNGAIVMKKILKEDRDARNSKKNPL